MAILLGVVVALLGLPLILIAILVVLTLRSRRGKAPPDSADVSPTPPPQEPKAIGSPTRAKRGEKAASRRRAGAARPRRKP